MDKKNIQSGFTLIEALVALMVIGIMATQAVPRLQTYMKNIEFSSAVTGIRSQLKAAQVCAIANPAIHCGVHFDDGLNPNIISIFKDKNNPGGYDYEAGLDELHLTPLELPATVSMSINIPTGRDEIIFRGDGSAYSSGEIILSTEIRTDTIHVLASTGRIKVFR